MMERGGRYSRAQPPSPDGSMTGNTMIVNSLLQDAE